MKVANIVDEKSVQQDVIEAEGHETVALSIDPAGAEHVMHSLTNLYSQPVESVWREIINNALDAHLVSGQTKPIEITLNEAEFVVRDYGKGMSRSDLDNVYSKYAASTKRDSNKAVGAFGFGAKSPLAIVDRFDVESIHDGTEIKFYVQKNSRGVGIIHYVSEQETTKPSGVKVSIPFTKVFYERVAKLNNWFQCWKPGSVLLNGEIPPGVNVHNKEEFLPIYAGDNIIAWVRTRRQGKLAGSYLYGRVLESLPINVGGTKYSLTKFAQNIRSAPNARGTYNIITSPHDLVYDDWIGNSENDILYRIVRGGNEIVLNLPIGSVDFTPNREEIMETDKSKASIRSAYTAVRQALVGTFHKYLSGLEPYEAIRFFNSNLACFGVKSKGNTYFQPEFSNPDSSGIKYRGEEIPLVVKFDEPVHVATARTSSKWLDPLWTETYELNLFGMLNHKPGIEYKTTPHMSYKMPFERGGDITTIVVYGKEKFDEKTFKSLLSNSRSYVQAIDELKAYKPFVVYVQSATVPENAWLKEVAQIVSIEELTEIAKAYRRDKAKEAAARREKRGSDYDARQKPIHYGAIYKNGNLEMRKFSPAEISTQHIILVSEKECLNQKLAGRTATVSNNSNFGSARTFWHGTTWEQFSEKGHTSYATAPKLMITRIAKMFEDRIIIFVPEKRSEAVVRKQAERITSLYVALEEQFQKLATDQKKLEMLKLYADLPQEVLFGGKATWITNIVDAKEEAILTNPKARAFYKALLNPAEDELLNLVQIAKVFLPLQNGHEFIEANKNTIDWDLIFSILGPNGSGTGTTPAKLLSGIKFTNFSHRYPVEQTPSIGEIQATVINNLIQ